MHSRQEEETMQVRAKEEGSLPKMLSRVWTKAEPNSREQLLLKEPLGMWPFLQEYTLQVYSWQANLSTMLYGLWLKWTRLAAAFGVWTLKEDRSM
jgi:hypothetical protein